MKRWIWLLLLSPPGLSQCLWTDHYLTSAHTQAISKTQLHILTQSANIATLNVTSFSGRDIGAQLNSAQASSQCASGCTLAIPPGNYTLATSALVTSPNIHIVGKGAASVIPGSGLTSMLTLAGTGDSVSGVNFDLHGRVTYGVVAAGGASSLSITNNVFTGGGPYAIYAHYAGSGLEIANNTFASDSKGFGPGPMTLEFVSDFNVTGNHFKNTVGFGIPTLGSHNGVIANNDFYEPQLITSATAASGQTSFSLTLPSYATRLFAKVNGVPTPLANTRNTGGNNWTATFSSPPGSGARVTFIGYQALEDIQVNSQSFDIAITGNMVNGSGDTAIDVVSSYHAKTLQTITSASNQTLFKFTGSPGFFPAVSINGRILTGSDMLGGGPVKNGLGTWTVTLAKPQPAGTPVSFVDDFISEAQRTQADYPANVTISTNTVSNAAAACISPEVPANNIDITGNVLENCGQGLGRNTSFSTAIFATGSPVINITDNTIISSASVPTMSFGIEMLGFFTDTGTPTKTVVISGNTFRGFGSSQTRIYIPTQTPTTRQIGIDIRGTDVPYPETIDLDSQWKGLPRKTAHWTYANSSATVTRDTVNTNGGAASLNVTSKGTSSKSYVSIFPSDYRHFANSILKVTFSAKAISGTMDFQILSYAGGVYAASTVPIASTSWQKYALYLATTGLDFSQPIFIRIGSPSTATAQAVFQNITLASTPIDP
jgi:hypothetical protein